MKTSVYSWRIESARKRQLEELARRQNRSVADVLDEAVSQWLEKQGANDADDSEQQRLRRAAATAFGTISGGDPDRAANARLRVRDELRRRRK